MQLNKLLFTAVLLGGATPMIAQVTQSETARQPSFSLSLTAALLSVHVGESLIVAISLTNITDSTTGVREDISHKGEFTYRVFAYAENQKKAPTTAYSRALWGGSLPDDPPVSADSSFVTRRIQPGKSLVNNVDVTSLYDLTHPGTYTIWVERTDRVSHMLVKSNTVNISMTP